MTSFGRQFDFHDVITYILVTLIIDGVTSFLQLMDVKTYVKIRVSVQTRVTGNFNTSRWSNIAESY